MATPMQLQYNEIKEQYKDCIVFFRLGDFYEMFGEDAIKASKILNVTLTARNKGTENEQAMCGIPYHAASSYIAKLTLSGLKVAICEQVSNPSEKGIVKREVIKVVTPGTTFDENIIDQKNNQYLIAFTKGEKEFALAIIDVTTGDFFSTSSNPLNKLIEDSFKYQVKEVIYDLDIESEKQLLLNYKTAQKILPSLGFSNSEKITRQFKISSITSLGFDLNDAEIDSIGLILDYIFSTQKNLLGHLKLPKKYLIDDFVLLDKTTIKNLDLLEYSFTKNIEGSLVGVLDKTSTFAGARLLRYVLTHPLRDLGVINTRLEAIAELRKNKETLKYLIEILNQSGDLERILGRLGSARANGKDLLQIKNTLELLPKIKQIVTGFGSNVSSFFYENNFSDIIKDVNEVISETPPLFFEDGGTIKTGYNQELDELRDISTSGKDVISNIQEREIIRTGISSLKVKYTSVFGYFIEIPKAQISKVPSDYERRQTLVNAERFTIPELKNYEERIFSAESKIISLERMIFSAIIQRVMHRVKELQELALSLAWLDILATHSLFSITNNYNKPVLDNSNNIIIKNGRHAVIETVVKDGRYISNDTNLNQDGSSIVLLSGPNMGGKSSYLRQVAIITLLSQCGFFVPATEAQIGLVDKIFTRVGASDNLYEGHSTFMVEMQESANILNNATSKSLIILDEIGRGTSTYDGVSLAWSILKYIHDHLGSKTIFATHYHELIDVVEKLKNAKNYSVGIKESADGIVFLYSVSQGAISKSYGIEVAKRAGLPEEVINEARTILKSLETKTNNTSHTQRSLF